MKYSVRISLEAKQHLDAIGRYIAEDSAEQAKRWRRNLFQQIRSLETFPHREIVYPAQQVGRDIRHIFFGVYRILFTIERDTVVVLAIRHGARKPLSPKDIRKLD